MTKYKATIVFTCNGHPRHWLPEIVEQSLYEEDERLIDCEIESLEDD